MKYTGILIMLLNVSLYAQNFTDIWQFGDSAGLSFSTGNPEYILGSNLVSKEACCGISDSLGDLLFYSSSYTIWNKNSEIMENGENIGGSDIGNYPSSITNGCLIIPDPGSHIRFYIFTLDLEHFAYSVIDMSLDGGNGEVIIKDELILSEAYSEKLAGVRHANGRDWWIIIHPEEGSFMKYLLTPIGIEGPFIQAIGNADSTVVGGIGEMTFSEQGDKLIFVSPTFVIDLFDFDRCSGELSNLTDLKITDTDAVYGASFSSDGCKLYVSEYSLSSRTYQYNLCQGDILESRSLIFEAAIDDYYIGQHQLGPDGKIYIAMGYNINPNDVYTDQNMNLHVINNPNEEGLACNFDTSSIWLGGKRSFYGLPNFPNYNLGALSGSECDSLSTALHTINKKDAISIYPNPASTSFIISGNVSFGDEVVMYNATGQLLLQEKIIANQSIDISGIPSGIYVVQLKNNEVIKYAEKFIKVEGNNKK